MPGNLATNFDPSLPILQAIAQTQAEIGDADAAVKTVGNMGSSGSAHWIRNNTIEKIVESQLKAGDPAGALKTADLLKDQGQFTIGPARTKMLESIARHQSKAGQASSVLEWAARETVPDAKLHAMRTRQRDCRASRTEGRKTERLGAIVIGACDSLCRHLPAVRLAA